MEPVSFINDNLLKEDEKLLYLTYFGSQLYGMSNKDSDLDFKGIFLPSKKDLLLMNQRKSINWKTGDDTDKNSSEDIDIELWSLHYFLDLVKKGETGAIDLLYSPSNRNCWIYKTGSVIPLFENPLSLFDPRNTKSFIGYAIGQAKKYSCRGSRLGVLKQIYRYLEGLNPEPFTFDCKLKELAPDILKNFYDPSYCFTKELNGDNALVVCGKVHMYSIKVNEFYNRIEREYSKYGERAEKAERNEGIDWKAISHAIRCICQLKELLTYGEINFPLKDASFLYQIKNGEYNWTTCEEYIVNGLNEVEKLQEDTDVRGEYNNKFVERMILSLYNE